MPTILMTSNEMTKFQYIGSGGKRPRTPTITNDNLFSKDKVEILLGVGEGQIEGLENGLKSFFAGDVPLQDNNGNTIIKDLVASEKKGEPTATTITFTLGGESASTSVGVNILQKSPVVRYTPENFRGKINKLDIRITVAQLFHETASGDVLNNTAQFRIDYKTARGSDPWVVLDFSNATPNRFHSSPFRSQLHRWQPHGREK
jgi:predicted phage tail protein